MQKQHVLLPAAILLTAIIALSAHVIILQYFSAPMVSNITPDIMIATGVTIKFLMVLSAIWIFLYSQHYWMSINLSYRIILFAILLLALTEQLFRSPTMDIVVGMPWKYIWLERIPTYIGFLTISLIICLFLPKANKTKSFKLTIYTVISIATTFLLIFIQQFFSEIIEPFLLSLYSEAHEIALLPYGANILIPAYLTFLEPTIAAFIVYHLIKNQLSKFNLLVQGLIMGILIVAIHAGIYSILLILFSDGNIFYRIFYHGQFLWEYLILGMLTVFSSVLVLQQRVNSHT